MILSLAQISVTKNPNMYVQSVFKLLHWNNIMTRTGYCGCGGGGGGYLGFDHNVH